MCRTKLALYALSQHRVTFATWKRQLIRCQRQGLQKLRADRKSYELKYGLARVDTLSKICLTLRYIWKLFLIRRGFAKWVTYTLRACSEETHDLRNSNHDLSLELRKTQAGYHARLFRCALLVVRRRALLFQYFGIMRRRYLEIHLDRLVSIIR